jgi:hypothetical protein
MKVLARILSVLAVCCVMVILLAGCGVSEKKLKDAEQRMQTLQSNGVPDSLLTEARVLISQSRVSKKLGNGIGAKTEYDSAMTILAKAEGNYGTTTAELKPSVEAIRKSLGDKKLNLSGVILKEADSLLAFIDALMTANKWPDAKAECQEVVAIFAGLEKDQQLAKEVKPKLAGTWSGSQAFKEDGANAVEKKQFAFAPDGKIDIVEERSGATTPSFKEDWKFQSSGTYDVKGDTILIAITKEKCLKQVFQHLKEKGKKKEWVKVEKPPYDSVITGGKKDRYMTFEFLKGNFKKK